MKQVVFFTPRYPPYGGGSATYSREITKELSDEISYKIITFTHEEKPFIESEDGMVIYRVLPHTSRAPFPVRALIESAVSLLFAIIITIRWNIGIFHIHAGSYATPGLAVASILSRTPIIYDCRDEMFPPSIVRFGRVKAIFSCSKNVDDHLSKVGIDKSQIARIPVVNPGYISDVEPNVRTNDSFRVIFVGRMIKSKGAGVLIESFKEFYNDCPESELTLIGDDPQNIAKDAVNSIPDAKINFCGELPHKQVLAELASNDVLVLPSESEGMPRVVIEAFELGVPVVCTPVGAIPGLVSDHITGIIIDQNKKSIHDALSILYEQPELRSRISRNEKQLSEGWNWDVVSERIFHHYDE